MNEKMEKAREVALGILKPSKKDLEHGLKLHRSSIVFDAYGFAPRSSIDVDKLQQIIDQGASQTEINDLREEMTQIGHVFGKKASKEFQQVWKASGVTCIFQNAGQEGNAVDRLIKRLARFTYVTDAMPDFLIRVVSPRDITTAKKQDLHCIYFSSNGVPLAQEWNSVEEELSSIRIFFQLGIRMMHLTYNRRNMIGDGCGEKNDGGLSDFGQAVIKEMNRVGVIVDVAHSGLRTSLDAAKVSKKPIVASHSACLSLNKHCRVKSDEVIKLIADRGGYIGICCIPKFLGLSSDIQAFLEHITYVAKKFGVEHVAIGTDTAYVPEDYHTKLEKIRMPHSRPPWRLLWPEGSLDTKGIQENQRLSLSWTNWPLFTVGLVQRGFSDKDIQKIIGGNVLRVAQEVLSNKW